MLRQKILHHLAVSVLMLVMLGVADVTTAGQIIKLPPPQLIGTRTLEQLLAQRRSVRTYSAAPISLNEVGQMLWAAQGITHSRGLRTAPSAGALYPLELYVVAGAVDGLDAGIYHYLPREHSLVQTAAGERREALVAAALGQKSLQEAAAVIAIAAIQERTRVKYGERAERYVHMEVGHAGQNMFLQAEALGLGTVVIGAFHDEAVAAALGLPAGTRPLSLMPLGHRR